MYSASQAESPGAQGKAPLNLRQAELSEVWAGLGWAETCGPPRNVWAALGWAETEGARGETWAGRGNWGRVNTATIQLEITAA